MAEGEICIIGEEKSESNIRLLEEAKKVFSSVFFVPISAIHIGLTDRFTITYRATDMLKFKAIIPRIPGGLCSYAYQLLSLFPEDTYMATRPIAFLLAEERFFLLTVLRKRGISTINMRLARTTEAAGRVLEANSFPLVIRAPGKKSGVVVNNKSEAKSIVDALASLKQPVLIEDVVKDMASVYVAGPKVLATFKKKTKEKDVTFGKGELKNKKLDDDIRQLALDAASAIETQVARVDITMEKEPKVVNIELNPGLITPSSAANINLPKMVVEAVKENYKAYRERPMLMRFFEDASSVVKDVLKTKHMLI